MTTRRVGKHRIYMNVGYELTEEDLRQFFTCFGQVTDVYLPKHKSGRNKGFGFTTFETEKALEAALQSQEHVIQGHLVKINRAGPRPEHEVEQTLADRGHSLDAPVQPSALHGKGPRLYVGGIAEDLGEEKIRQHFSKWGNVVDVYFPGKGRPKRVNYCFVTFDNWRAAQRACLQSERCIAGSALQSINIAEERVTDHEQQQAALAAGAAVAAGGGPSLAAYSPNMLIPMGAPPGGFGAANLYSRSFGLLPDTGPALQQQLALLPQQVRPHSPLPEEVGRGMLPPVAALLGSSTGFGQPPSAGGSYGSDGGGQLMTQQQQQQLAQVISLQQLAVTQQQAAVAALAQHQQGQWSLGGAPQPANSDMSGAASSLLSASTTGPSGSQTFAGGLPGDNFAPNSFTPASYPPQTIQSYSTLPTMAGVQQVPQSMLGVSAHNIRAWGLLSSAEGPSPTAHHLAEPAPPQGTSSNLSSHHQSSQAAPLNLISVHAHSSQPFPSPGWN